MKINITYWIGILFFCLACENPFAIRDAEEPKNPSSSWILPDSHGSTLVNFINAIKERNTENLMGCLVSPEHSDLAYRFVPDPQIAVNHPEVFVDWSLEKEEAVFKQIFFQIPDDSTSGLEFYEDIREIVTADSAIVVKQYRLSLQHTVTDLPSVYEGQLEFWFHEDQRGWWVIYYWSDNSVSELQPWTFLKASLGG